MNLNSIPAFQNNYIWVLSNNDRHCLIVGPDEVAPVLKVIAEHSWMPGTILLTRHHQDHVSGVEELLQHYPRIVVYGPVGTQDKGTTHVVKDGDIALVLGHEFKVIATPGHTLGYIYYLSRPYLLCGDILFSSDCGRLFGGTVTQMYQLLKKIDELPDDTLICCAHEYTLANMKLALSILPHDSFINEHYRKVNELRIKKQMALPIVLENERQDNLLLRTGDTDLINEINKETILQQPEGRFAWLRSKKDTF